MSIARLKKRRIRRRRSAVEARDEAIAAARELLLAQGPDGVTLKAVAHEIGMTHTNLLHHFGSASELQSALMSAMVRDLSTALGDAVVHLRSDEGAPRALVDMVFDAFDKGGAGQLAAWIALSNKQAHLEPIQQAVGDLVNAIEEKFAPGSDARQGVTSAVLFIALCAFGDAIIGAPLVDMLGRERAAGRKVTAYLLPKFFAPG
ncbi:MAG TPA: helix-turn-helix domain-containing protein [Rhizomicrobium sp.]|nr:helix-turn-helix domain-containing protein [Rhizomicrobium sp.]